MAYTYEVQTIEAQGIPYVEFRNEAEPTKQKLITIKFALQIHPLDDYTYNHPLFVFGDMLALREQWEYCQQNQLDPNEELDTFWSRIYPILLFFLVKLCQFLRKVRLCWSNRSQ